MEKYLFTDGTNVIREAGSRQELQSLIQSSADTSNVRIWVFSTSEWVTVADLNKRLLQKTGPVTQITATDEAKQSLKGDVLRIVPGFLKKAFVGVVSIAAIFLVYNFTRLTWRKASALSIVAERPVNAPLINADSLITAVELSRGQKLDKITKTNLRIRNTWPDLLQLQLTADRDTSREGLRYHHLEFSIDNSTGYNIDNAVVKFSVWKGDEVTSDTLHFDNITYAAPAKRKIETAYRGDSISVSFVSIRAKAFNFCYSSEKKGTSVNSSDRWYCR